MNISNLDLNLLTILDAVSRERSVSRAALRLGLSQPRVSNALTELRAVFGDPLFTRTGNGVAPTELMKMLAPRIREALGVFEDCLVQHFRFEPALSERTFRLHMSDSTEMVGLPMLHTRVRRLAPRVRLETLSIDAARIPQALRASEIDFAIGSYGSLGDDVTREPVFNDALVLLAGSASLLQDWPSREELQRARYIVVGESLEVEQLVADLGLSRRISVRVSNCLAVPALLAAGDLVAWIPLSVAAAITTIDGFRIVITDVQQRTVAVNLFSSRQAVLDPGLMWMAKVIRSVLHHIGKADEPSD